MTDNLPYPISEKTQYGFSPKLTKDDPGSIWHLLYLLAQHTGFPAYTLTDYPSIREAVVHNKPGRLVLKSNGQVYYPFSSHHGKGSVLCFLCGFGQKVYATDNFESICGYRVHTLADYIAAGFTQLVLPVGTCKECLGGGWSTEIPLVEFKGYYFAPEMTLSNGVEYNVQKSLGLSRENVEI